MLEKLGYLAFREVLEAGDATPLPMDYYAAFDKFAHSRPWEAYDTIHALRFRETAKEFGPYLRTAKNVVELGGHGRIGAFTLEVLGVQCQSYEGELREPFNLPDAAFDVVLCLEVLEHMKDRPSQETDPEHDVGCWNYSGTLNLLSESHRILRVGGRLLVTTPNATSLDTLRCVLEGRHPFMFEPHVRELAPRQVKAFGELAGFTLEAFGTFFAWSLCDGELREKLLRMIAALGFDTSHRGDDAFYVFRK